MRVKFLVLMLVTLLTTITVFSLDTRADSESTSQLPEFLMICLVIVLMVVAVVYFGYLWTRKTRTFLKENSRQLSSEDPKILLELSEKCNEYLKHRYSPEIVSLSQQAKGKAKKIQKKINFQANLEVFKSKISKDGAHPAIISTLKEHMHNPDSFEHVSSNYETIETEGKHYHKIIMVFRGTNTFGALVLQTCFFVLNEDNQISLVGSPNGTEFSAVNTEKLSVPVDAVLSLFEGIASIADILSFFGSE